MNRPYIAALKRPCATFSEPFMKKETVIGTIGNTHGVRSMANPQRIASRMSAQICPLDSFFCSGAGSSSAEIGITALTGSIETLKSKYSALHAPPVHEFEKIVPLIVAPGPVTFTSCAMMISS